MSARPPWVYVGSAHTDYDRRVLWADEAQKFVVVHIRLRVEGTVEGAEVRPTSAEEVGERLGDAGFLVYVTPALSGNLVTPSEAVPV